MSHVDWSALGHRLRVARVVLDISECEAARACGVARRTYCGYEKGRRQRGDRFVDFADKYDVSIEWLARGEAAYVRRHLTRGRVAVAPIAGPSARRVRAGFRTA